MAGDPELHAQRLRAAAIVQEQEAAKQAALEPESVIKRTETNPPRSYLVPANRAVPGASLFLPQRSTTQEPATAPVDQLDTAKQAYLKLTRSEREQFVLWLSNGCPKKPRAQRKPKKEK